MISFPSGNYLYLGSARGPGGLRARLGRHLTNEYCRPHWHIDYLRQIAQPVAVYYYVIRNEVKNILTRSNESPIECLWSQTLASQAFVRIPVTRFGASECRKRCGAHLVYYDTDLVGFSPQSIQKILNRIFTGKSNIANGLVAHHVLD